MKLKLPLFCILSAFFIPFARTNAQFYTVVDKRSVGYEIINRDATEFQTEEFQQDTTIIVRTEDKLPQTPMSTEASKQKQTYCTVRKKHLEFDRQYGAFPDLTLNSLLREIRKNGIQHEQVVLAQAILETGWFTSSVCRNKKNLFGLTNPRTGQYYEFEDWRDSVKAYYTKVQYRYKGGNYLLWLDKIGYAEDKVYVLSLIRLLKQYFI